MCEVKRLITPSYYQLIGIFAPKRSGGVDRRSRACPEEEVNLAINYGDAVKNMIEIIAGPVDSNRDNSANIEFAENKTLKSTALEFFNALEELVQYFPISPVLEQVAPLTEKQKKICNYLDSVASMLVYYANRFFNSNTGSTNTDSNSKPTQSDGFYLIEDVKVFIANIFAISEAEKTDFAFREIEKFITHVDYITGAIEPLVWNAFQHAFNPANDVYSRLQTNFLKFIRINGYPEQEVDISPLGSSGYTIPADSGNYIVVVKDNGFGIQPDVLPHVFDKGFTTKTDKEGHGIGLWAVKEFVEQNNGIISVETKLDEGTTSEHGTTFKFTIPYYYDHDKSMCVQRR